MDVSNLKLKRVKEHISKNRWKSSERYFNQKDKLLHIGAEALLNYIFKKIRVNNPIYDVNCYGKPYLKNYPKIHFNISHSEKYVFCGVSNQPIGVDIECNQDIDLNIAETYFHPKEYEYIMNNEDKNKSFFDMWTLKESYLKMKGVGLNSTLNSFIINIEKNKIYLIPVEKGKNSIERINKRIKFKSWNIKDDEKKKYSLAVCSFETINKLNSIDCDKIY